MDNFSLVRKNSKYQWQNLQNPPLAIVSPHLVGVGGGGGGEQDGQGQKDPCWSEIASHS
jgi:hypothetical protein